MLDDFKIYQASTQDLAFLNDIAIQNNLSKDPGYFERCLERQEQGHLLVLIGKLYDDDENRAVSYALLNWLPKYGLFKKLGIPEIQDLNVTPVYRRKGIAKTMIGYCEKLAREKGYEQLGIGVGLHSSYGPAQRLYIKLGYVPDGEGVNYDRKVMGFGELKHNDDNLCLMMMKVL